PSHYINEADASTARLRALRSRHSLSYHTNETLRDFYGHPLVFASEDIFTSEEDDEDFNPQAESSRYTTTSPSTDDPPIEDDPLVIFLARRSPTTDPEGSPSSVSPLSPLTPAPPTPPPSTPVFMAQPVPMPGTGNSPYRLSFKGDARYLLDFFAQYETAALAAQLNQEQMCRNVLVYVEPLLDKELWRSLPGYNPIPPMQWSWTHYKAQILAEYPAATSPRFTFNDLVSVARIQNDQAIRTVEDVGKYGRRFRMILNWLTTNNQNPGQQAATLFLKGFDANAREKIQLLLKITYPARDRSSYTVDEIYNAAQREFENCQDHSLFEEGKRSSFDMDWGFGGNDDTWEIRREPTATRNVPRVVPKPEPMFGNDALKSFTDAMAAQLQQQTNAITALTVALTAQTRAPPPPIPYPSPSIPSGPSQPRATASAYPGCAFCGQTGHMVRNCPVVTDYISQGKAKRTADGSRLLTPGDTQIPPGFRGQTLKERLDIWLTQNPQARVVF
ncbi:hypothetical protein SISSUDRAFT_1068103, partial [Sistotremastrum suecicum HHB10207 ss-3]